MARDEVPSSPTSLVDAVCAMPGYRSRARFLRQNQAAFAPELACALRTASASAVRRDPREANELARLGLLVANATRDAEERTQCLRALAQAHLVAGTYRGALRAVDQAIEGPRADGDSLTVAELEALRIPILAHLERYAEAREAGRRALEVLGETRQIQGVFRVHMALADLSFRNDRPREALRHYAAAEDACPDGPPRRLQALLAVNRGNALEACNRFQAAARQFALAREIFAEDGLDHTVAQIDYNAAYAEFLRSHYEDALRRYARIEETFLRLEDERHLAHIALDRAEIHLHLNLPDDALAFAIDAERRFGKLKLEKEAAQAAQHVGRAASLGGDLVAAGAAYGRAEERFARLGLVERQIGCLVARAYLAKGAGQPEQAHGLARAARDLLDVDMNPLSAAAVGLLFAHLALECGRPDDALARAEDALARCRRIHAPWAVIEAWRLAARAHTDRGDLAAAIRAYQHAIEHLEHTRSGVPPDEYMAAFLGGRAGLYADLVDLLVRTGDTELAFEFTERAKSRALVDLLAGQAVEVNEGGRRHPTPRRVRYLRQRLDAVYRRITEAAVAPGTPAARSLREARAQAGEYEQEIARILRTRRLEDPEGTSLQAVDAPDLAAVRQELEEGTTLIEYFISEQGLYAFVIDSHETHVVRQEIRESDLRRQLERFHFHLSKYERPDLDAEDLVARATRANLEKLAAVLIDPISPYLDGTRLVIVPHGILHHLPFHALPWGDEWLSDQFEIVYAPSAAVYGYCGRRGPAAKGPACVFGLPDDQAPQIEEESLRVGRLLQSDRVYLRDEATLERLREQARGARIVHIATHGMFRHAEPMLSSFRLADRWVNLYDLYRLEVRGELVVLSTCESGVADVTDGDEVLGLTRGFLYAGARALLTSQWRVHDAVTAEFMEAFYRGLDELGDAAAAHKQAMAAIRARHPHPYYWAPFFLTGRPVSKPARQRPELVSERVGGRRRPPVPLGAPPPQGASCREPLPSGVTALGTSP